ncbi:hypothetical protein [Brevibacterium casei]|uniref:Uncharacterized protein n=1 Tax=Brevibacterium casei TaxID=33889 RepID=A0A7T2TH13_9MICO|nr:hypothetical protein [Brevibacterium casei]QPS33621.1 hypothetical protein I6G59_17130 [Brevibacterium casei]
MAGEEHLFRERPDKHRLNRRNFARTRYAAAELANGDPGVMFTVDGRIVVLSKAETIRFATNLIDLLERRPLGHD